MGIFTYTDEYTSPIPPARLFKALVVDSHNLFPKIMPQVIKSIDVIQGEGGTGVIKQLNFKDSQLSPVKSRLDELNEETFTYKFTMIEGGPITDMLESISFEVKFEATPEGGSKNKMTSAYYTKGDAELKEEDIKMGKEAALGRYKLCEAYLLQNPETCA